jgi:hypothetical protein
MDHEIIDSRGKSHKLNDLLAVSEFVPEMAPKRLKTGRNSGGDGCCKKLQIGYL